MKTYPVDENGEMIRYTNSSDIKEYKDCKMWSDELEYTSFARGTSAAYFIFVSKNDGKRYFMFLKDFTDSITYLKSGTFKGLFNIVKRGTNYGVRFLG